MLCWIQSHSCRIQIFDISNNVPKTQALNMAIPWLLAALWAISPSSRIVKAMPLPVSFTWTCLLCKGVSAVGYTNLHWKKYKTHTDTNFTHTHTFHTYEFHVHTHTRVSYAVSHMHTHTYNGFNSQSFKTWASHTHTLMSCNWFVGSWPLFTHEFHTRTHTHTHNMASTHQPLYTCSKAFLQSMNSRCSFWSWDNVPFWS